MAQKRSNDHNSEWDLQSRAGANADDFDIFNFSDVDMESVGRVKDDLDLDSFLNFDDLSQPETPAADEPMSEPKPEPEPEEDAELEAKRQKRKARKEAAFAELFGQPKKPQPDLPPENAAAAEETADEMPAPEDAVYADETPVPGDTVYADETPFAEELPPEDEPAPERRRGLFARFLKTEDPLEDEAPLEEEEHEEKPSFLRGLFARAKDETQTPPEKDAEEKSTGGKISFFTRLTPEKEKFQALMQAKKADETRPEAPQPRSVPMAAGDNTGLTARIQRQPKRGEELVYDSELDELDYIDPDDLPESRDYLPIRFRRYGRSGIGGGLMYAAFVISVSIILACFGWLCASDVLALSKAEASAVVVVESYIPKDTDLLNEDGEPVDEDGNVITCDIDQVAQALKDGEIINFKFLFKLFSKLSHAYYKIDPGTYNVSTHLDYRALVTEMQTGSESQEITKITFPEGYRMEQIFQLLEDNDICDYDDLMDAAANHNYSYSWLDEEWYYEAEGDPTRLEGYLFPDTYEFYQGENAINVINRFLLRFHGLLTQDMYQQAENLGITLHEAVIVASLIEKEAGANDDRSNFSSVIYNRLDAGMTLGLDSTINYIQNTSTFHISTVDTQVDSPYNTYLYTGLPKGPICSAGLASLNAALKPNSTNYWYWYAYEGSTYFFTNYSDQQSFAYDHPY